MEDMSEEVKKAYELWQNLNLNEEEREIAEHRYMELASMEYAKKYEHDLGREEGKKQGLAEGLAEGREEGKKEGEILKQKEIAKEMLKKGFEVSLIAEITKLSEDEINELK